MNSVIDDSFVQIPAGSIFVRCWSSGHSHYPPLILLHDSLGSVDLWRDFPPALATATGRDVIAYDRLGFGKSTPRTGRPSLQFIEEEAEIYFPAIQRALEIERYALFGHSVGGGMALAIAAVNREQCEAVISESAQAFVERRTIEAVAAAKSQFSDPAEFEKIARWHGDKARWVLDAWTEIWLSPEFSSWKLDDQLGKIQCPVLAIHGDADEYGSVEFPTRITSKVNGQAQLSILPGCGHLPHREKREVVLHLVSSFLENVSK